MEDQRQRVLRAMSVMLTRVLFFQLKSCQKVNTANRGVRVRAEGARE